MTAIVDREATRDGYMDSSAPSSIVGGTLEGYTGDVGAMIARGLIGFNIADVGATRIVTPGSSIIKITPLLEALSAFACHLWLCSPFEEDNGGGTAGATWLERIVSAAQAWISPGGDFSLTLGQAFTAPTTLTQKVISGAGLDAAVQSAVASGSGFLGFVIKGDAENIGDFWGWWQRGHGVPADSPLLSFEHEAAPAPSGPASARNLLGVGR